jgi:wyosine [tRNA(Phe)-imidazoG37] synthetase (radical SAM superfamily)
MTDTKYACNVKCFCRVFFNNNFTLQNICRDTFIPEAVYRQHVKGAVAAVVN